MSPSSAWIMYQLRNSHKLVSRTERLRAKELLNPREIAELIRKQPNLVDHWRQQGLLKGTRLNDKNEYLYQRPETAAIQQIKQRTRLKDANHLCLDTTYEAQYKTNSLSRVSAKLITP